MYYATWMALFSTNRWLLYVLTFLIKGFDTNNLKIFCIPLLYYNLFEVGGREIQNYNVSLSGSSSSPHLQLCVVPHIDGRLALLWWDLSQPVHKAHTHTGQKLIQTYEYKIRVVVKKICLLGINSCDKPKVNQPGCFGHEALNRSCHVIT